MYKERRDKMIAIKEEEIRKEIAKKGYTLSEFAEKVGIKKTYLSRILKRKSISPKKAQMIVEGLGVHFEDIFFIKIWTNDQETNNKTASQ